jgi:hypothetical protein
MAAHPDRRMAHVQSKQADDRAEACPHHGNSIEKPMQELFAAGPEMSCDITQDCCERPYSQGIVRG